MKKVILALFLFVTIINAQNKSPKIYSPEPHYNFGEIVEGQIVEHEFEIINQGNDDLIIKDVRASCGCTAVQPSQKILKPNEKTKIKIEFDSRGRLGPQKKYVFVFNNDPTASQYQLSFDAVVIEKPNNPFTTKKPKLVLSTKEYNFGNVEEGKILEANIGIKNDGTGTLQIKDVKTTCGCTAVLLNTKVLQPGEATTVKINLDTTNREGQFIRTVSIYSNDPENSVQIITLLANIRKKK
ncbi:MAG: DUF1573 domain-containing protein [Melioribacter sp.]|nr:DUF1573 domain-containing protein [Melioribacter sp.]